MQLTDGFYKNEKALLPKQLNLVFLKNKAKNRSNEEEAVLTAARNKRLADQRNLEKNIADQKTDTSFEKFDALPELIYTADTAKESCKTYLQNISKRTQPFNRVEIMDAADLIIAKTLAAKAADAAILKNIKVGLSNGVLDRHKLKSTIKDMRAELISSREFLDTFSKRLSPSEFYNEYRKAINKNVNKTIKDEYARSKAVNKTNRADRLRINRFLKDNVQEITAKQAKDIKTFSCRKAFQGYRSDL